MQYLLILLSQIVCTNEKVDERASRSCGGNVNPVIDPLMNSSDKDSEQSHLYIMNGLVALLQQQELRMKKKDLEIKELKRSNEDKQDRINTYKIMFEQNTGLENELKKRKEILSEKDFEEYKSIWHDALRARDNCIEQLLNKSEKGKKSKLELLKGCENLFKHLRNKFENDSSGHEQDDKTASSLNDLSDVNCSKSHSGPDSSQSMETSENQGNTFVSELRAMVKESFNNSVEESNLKVDSDEFFSLDTLYKALKEIQIEKSLKCSKLLHSRRRSNQTDGNSEEENEGSSASKKAKNSH